MEFCVARVGFHPYLLRQGVPSILVGTPGSDYDRQGGRPTVGNVAKVETQVLCAHEGCRPAGYFCELLLVWFISR